MGSWVVAYAVQLNSPTIGMMWDTSVCVGDDKPNFGQFDVLNFLILKSHTHCHTGRFATPLHLCMCERMYSIPDWMDLVRLMLYNTKCLAFQCALLLTWCYV